MNTGSMSKFQLAFLSAMVVVVVAAVGIFALNRSSTGATSTVTIWGTLPDVSMQTFLQRPDITASLTAKKLTVKYVAKVESTFDQDLVNAIASGKGPDAVIISQDAMLQYLDKIVPIPYSSFSEANFKKTYIQEAELFLTAQGSAAIPFTIDPMVMYWNRTLFTNAGISAPPMTWTQLYGTTGAIAKINKIDINHNIIKTAVALGTANNVYHYKDILSLLMMQAGTPIVSKNANGVLQSALGSGVKVSDAGNASQAALTFYTQFANPAKDQYSWNSALPLSRDDFTAGDLALYFGYASELKDLYARNPNLNFEVAPMPQSLNNPVVLTFGKVYGLAILKNAPNPTAVADAFIVLSNSASQAVWSAISGYPPVTRDLLAKTPSDAFQAVFYTSALQSSGWLDPNRTATTQIFGDMIGAVLSGAKLPDDALQDADIRLNTLLTPATN